MLYGTTTNQLNSAADHNEAVIMTMYNVTEKLSKSLHGVVTIRVCYKFNADTLKVWQLYRTHWIKMDKDNIPWNYFCHIYSTKRLILFDTGVWKRLW